ncbi:MAG: hypothetical protein Q8P18_10875 [Pseudomonadota bacterium]|nr:hypothetical protein [Pseudomonadota bacterium]
MGVGWGRDAHLSADGTTLEEQPLVAAGVAYGARVGLGIRLGRDFLFEVQARGGRSPFAWGVDGTPLDYAFARGWEVETGLALGFQIN